MQHNPPPWPNPATIIRSLQPEHPVLVFAPSLLKAAARRFLDGFPGLVTYAVKSNPDEALIRTLVEAGIRGFDVASPVEIDLITRLAPGAARHYHNPVRSPAEIAHAVAAGVKAWSVDSITEMEKLFAQVPAAADCEISPRFKLPVAGAAYDFGAKFGATPEVTADLLHAVAQRGYRASLTFHPGTQCTDPAAWETYIRTAREIADRAGVRPARLNVGGGFPSHRVSGIEPDLDAIFALIAATATEAFDGTPPELVCEPGRGLCADAYALITRVKALRDGKTVFLNDGVYGALSEIPLIGNLGRIEVFAPDGTPRMAEVEPRTVFGPTCDSMDRLPGDLPLPGDMEEGDFVVFQGAGAYSVATATRFNGFGDLAVLTAAALE